MEDRIKTALERALERAGSFRDVSPEEIARIENIPRGRALGASFMNNKGFNIGDALGEVPAEVRKYVIEGLQEVLLMNITLPTDEAANQTIRRAMEGIPAIKRDVAQVSAVLGELDHMLQYYNQTVEQTRERFKQEMEMRGRVARRQGVRDRNMERMEFREEWAALMRQMNARFETGLAELKERIRKTD